MSTQEKEQAAVIFDATEESNLLNTERHDSFELSDDDQQTFIQSSDRQSDVFDFDDHLIPLSLTETQRRPTSLEKEVTFFNGLTLVVGLMIGSGIFASPGPVALHAGSVGMSLVVWIVCGFLACTGALTYAELGSEIPLSGGEHAYLNHAYGSLLAFLYSWTAITCLKPGSNAIIAVIFAEYINRIVYHSAFNVNLPDETRVWLNKIVASLCIIIISFINAYSVRLATRTQDIFTALKLITLAVIAVIGFVVLGKGGFTNNFEGDVFEGSSTRTSDYALAFYSGLWAYDGWNNVNYVTGEMKNPARDLPRVIMVGLPIVIVCYTLANVAYYAVLPSSVVTNTNTIALDFGRKVFGPVGGVIFALCVAASCFGAANGSIFTGSRLIYVAAREGYLPSFLGKVHGTWNTPTAALIMQAVLTIVMIIPGTFLTLLNFVSVAAWIFYFLTSFGLLILRWREPDLRRPYKVWLSTPIIFCCVAIFLVIMPFARVPLQSLAAIGFILAGVPFWYIRVKYKETFSTQVGDLDKNIKNKIQWK
ncbi:8439_t:CDS:2 [Funneliformis caledonium]|uniref:8439_t:CDS:1 n=1 Tax=Funneliformis caledonium TaxID=1117310 RepID=A0A9N9FPZ6_9GLOM|nr:8439_t:CDS:2 [Funneliformis caledonium]